MGFGHRVARTHASVQKDRFPGRRPRLEAASSGCQSNSRLPHVRAHPPQER